jgi:hypothetical protein
VHATTPTTTVGAGGGNSYLRVVLHSVYTHQYSFVISTLRVQMKRVMCQICSLKENGTKKHAVIKNPII